MDTDLNYEVTLYQEDDNFNSAPFSPKVGEVGEHVDSMLPEQPSQVQSFGDGQKNEEDSFGEKEGSPDQTPEMTEELRHGYRILGELMTDGNKAVNWPFMNSIEESAPELADDYNERIEKPVWLKKMRDKFHLGQYQTITEFVTDFRLMLENCYRYNGPDHYISKRGQKLETMLEQKLALLSRDLRSKTSIAATSGQVEEDSGLGLRRRPKSLVPHDSTVLLNQLREAEAQRERELRRQQILDRKAEKEALAQEILNWEENVLFQGQLTQQMRAMWELPQIGLFLFLCQAPLNTGEIMHYELERCFLMPRESSTMHLVMTSLLSTPFQRTRINSKTMMPYKVWEEKLRCKLQQWYKIYADCGRDVDKTCLKLGLEHEFFSVVGQKNPLERRKYHELSYYRKVWILKGLCDYCLHTQDSLREAIESNVFEDQREYILGTDAEGQRYIHFPQFCGADVRIYRQAAIKMPKLEIKPDPEIKKRKFPLMSRPPIPKKIMKKKKNVKKVKAPTPPAQPVRTRPSRLRQTIKTVVPLQLEVEGRDYTDSDSNSRDTATTNNDEEEEEQEEEGEEEMEDNEEEEERAESGVEESTNDRLSSYSDTDSTIPYGDKSETNSTVSSRDCSRESSPFVNGGLDSGLRRSSRNLGQSSGVSPGRSLRPRASQNLTGGLFDEENSRSSDIPEKMTDCDTKKDNGSTDSFQGVERKDNTEGSDATVSKNTMKDFGDEASEVSDMELSDADSRHSTDVTQTRNHTKNTRENKCIKTDLLASKQDSEAIPSLTDSIAVGESEGVCAGKIESESDEDSQGGLEKASQLFSSSLKQVDDSIDGKHSLSKVDPCDSRVTNAIRESDTEIVDSKSHSAAYLRTGAEIQPVLTGDDDGGDDTDLYSMLPSSYQVEKTSPVPDFKENNRQTSVDISFQKSHDHITTIVSTDEASTHRPGKHTTVESSVIESNRALLTHEGNDIKPSVKSEIKDETSIQDGSDNSGGYSLLTDDVKKESDKKSRIPSALNNSDHDYTFWADGAEKREVDSSDIASRRISAETCGDSSNSAILRGKIKSESMSVDSSVTSVKTEIPESLSVSISDVKAEIDCTESEKQWGVKEESIKTEDNIKTEEQMKEEEEEETFPDGETFQLLADSVEGLRELTNRFAEPEPIIIKRGKKEQVMKPPPRKRCVVTLHERLSFLLKELEPWEAKLVQARKRARLKLRKEKEDYVEKEEENAGNWDTDEESDSNQSGSEDGDGTLSDKTDNDTDKKSRKAVIPKFSKGQMPELTVKVEEPEEIDVSLRGRLRKRRIIPNNAEDQIAPKKTKIPVKTEPSPVSHQPNILQKSNKAATSGVQDAVGVTQPPNNAGRILLGYSEIVRQLKGANSGSLGTNSGQILIQTSVGGQSVLTSLMPQGLQALQNIRFVTPQTSGQVGQQTLVNLQSPASSHHPTIQQLLSKPGVSAQSVLFDGEKIQKDGTSSLKTQAPVTQTVTNSVLSSLMVRPSGTTSQQTTPKKSHLVMSPAALSVQEGPVTGQNGQTAPQKLVLKTGPAQTPQSLAQKGKTTYYAANVNSLPPAVVSQLLKTPGAKIQTGPNQQNVLLIPVPASCAESMVTTQPSAVYQLATPSTQGCKNAVSQARTQQPVKTLHIASPVKPQGQVPDTVSRTALLSDSHALKTEVVSGLVVKPAIVPASHSPPPKYASNVTVKTLLEKRKSVDDKLPHSIATGLTPLKISVSETVTPPQSSVTLRTSPGLPAKQEIPATTATTLTKPPCVYTTISPAKLNNLLLQTNAAGAKSIPSLIKLPSKAVLDSAVKAVVTSVSTSLPTVNIKVPSPTSLPSIGPRRNVTKTIQSMKSPIPVAPKVVTQTKSGTVLSVVNSSVHVNPTQSLPVFSQANQINVTTASTAGIVKNMVGSAVLQNVEGKNVLTQGLVQGYMTPQGFVIPQKNQPGTQPATALLAQMGLQTLIQQAGAGNQVQLCQDASGKLQLVQTPAGLVHQTVLTNNNNNSTQQKVVPQQVQLKTGVQQATVMKAPVTQIQVQPQLAAGPRGKFLIVKPNNTNLSTFSVSLATTLPPASMPSGGAVKSATLTNVGNLKMVPAKPHTALSVQSPHVSSPTVSATRQVRPQVNVTTTPVKVPGVGRSSFLLPHSVPTVLAPSSSCAHREAPASPVLNLPSGYVLQGNSSLQLASPVLNQMPVNILQPAVAVPSPSAIVQPNGNLLQQVISPVQPLVNQQQLIGSSATMASTQPQLNQIQTYLSNGQLVISPSPTVSQVGQATSTHVVLNQVQQSLKPPVLQLQQNVKVGQIGDTVKRVIFQPVSTTAQVSQFGSTPVVSSVSSVVGMLGQTSASELVKQLAAAQLQSKLGQMKPTGTAVPEVKPVLLQQQLSTPPTSASAINTKHVVLQYQQPGQSPAHVEMKRKEGEHASQGKTLLQLVSSSHQVTAHSLPVTNMSTPLGTTKLVTSNSGQHQAFGSPSKIGASLSKVASGIPSQGIPQPGSSVDVKKLATVPTDAGSSVSQQQKLMLFSIGGQLVTGQGVPVTLDNGVLKMMPNAKVQIANQVLTPKQIQQTLAKISHATIPALNSTDQQTAQQSGSSTDSSTIKAYTAAQSISTAVPSMSSVDGSPGPKDSDAGDSIVRSGQGNVQFVLKPMVYSTGYIVCPRINNEMSKAGISTGAGPTNLDVLPTSTMVSSRVSANTDQSSGIAMVTLSSTESSNGGTAKMLGSSVIGSDVTVCVNGDMTVNNNSDLDSDVNSRIRNTNSGQVDNTASKSQVMKVADPGIQETSQNCHQPAVVSDEEAALNLLTLANQNFTDQSKLRAVTTKST